MVNDIWSTLEYARHGELGSDLAAQVPTLWRCDIDWTMRRPCVREMIVRKSTILVQMLVPSSALISRRTEWQFPI